jgi:hypothetical protein
MKNVYRIMGDIVYMQLDKKDGTSVETMISIEDLELISSVSGKWYLNQGYVKVSVGTNRKDKRLMQLHRFILGVHGCDPMSTEVDHRDRNPLNNTRDNLRIATKSINQRNKAYQEDKGVSKNSAGNWKATIGNRHLGTFKTKDEAIAVRREAVEELGSQWSSIGMNYRTTPQ